MTDVQNDADAIVAALHSKSDEELLAQHEDALAGLATECLNEALHEYEGTPIVIDGRQHPMTDFVEADKVRPVVVAARRLAVRRGIAVGRLTRLPVIHSDDDAIRVVLLGDVAV